MLIIVDSYYKNLMFIADAVTIFGPSSNHTGPIHVYKLFILCKATQQIFKAAIWVLEMIKELYIRLKANYTQYS